MGLKARTVKFYSTVSDRPEVIHLISKLFNADGGPGSGNFGHKGRPGKVGGSGEGGGKAFRTQSSEGNYVGIQKSREFRGIRKVAQKSKDAKEFIHSLSKEQRDMVSEQYRASGTKERIMDYTERLRQIMASQKPEIKREHKLVDGKDLSDRYVYNGTPYTDSETGQVIDTEIEHVLYHQGYMGVPKVVSQEELMDQIKEHPEMPVLFRSFSALGEDAVQSYDDMLEEGEFYVDCSNGGAQYGQGMYCAGVYGSDDYSGALSEMEHYRSVSAKNCQMRWYPDLAEGEDCISVSGKKIVYKQDEMKKTSEEKPPEAKEVIGLIKGPFSSEFVKGSFMPYDPSDDDSPLEFTYYTDAVGYQTVPIDTVSYWGPIEREAKPPAPSSSTRMMTLDPSARIISYKEVRDIQNKSDELKKEADGWRYWKQHEYTKDMPQGALSTLFVMGGEDVSQEELQLAEKFMKTEPEKFEQLRDWYEKTDVEYQKKIEEANKYKKYVNKDPGVVAAMLGYDAINAEGHGITDSYTVVLNRTKLILSQSRIDVA